MWDVFFTSVNAVIPIILLILLGYLLKRIKFINEFFVKIGNKFVLMFVCRVCCLSIFTIKWTVLQIFAGT